MGAKREISEQILLAAFDRIKHFGYAKTTMAEIAADLRMSAGNLYRFFASKLDIAEALAKVQRDKEVKALSEIVQRSDISAREKLKLALLHDACRIHALVHEEPRVVEIADIIAKERPQFLAQRLAEERVYLRQIIEEGIRTAEFDEIENIDSLTECIQSAVYKYRLPIICARMECEQLNKEMEAVLDLILRGLTRRLSQAS